MSALRPWRTFGPEIDVPDSRHSATGKVMRQPPPCGSSWSEQIHHIPDIQAHLKGYEFNGCLGMGLSCSDYLAFVLKFMARKNSKSFIHAAPTELQTSGTFRFARCLLGFDTSLVTTTRSDATNAYDTRKGS